MQGRQIYSKLKHFFPNHIQNLQLAQFSQNMFQDFQGLSFLISSSLPHLPIDQIHNLCKRQQKNVLDKIMQIKHIDLYQQIATVCPSQKNLRHMPTQEVTMKINQFTAKMALEQKMRQSSQDQMDSYSQVQEQKSSEESQQMMEPMEIDQNIYEPMQVVKGLHNIFQEEYNNHLPWNEMCIYDLN